MSGECHACGLSNDDCICYDEDDGLPECHDCGAELDPNGFCDNCDDEG